MVCYFSIDACGKRNGKSLVDKETYPLDVNAVECIAAVTTETTTTTKIRENVDKQFNKNNFVNFF